MSRTGRRFLFIIAALIFVISAFGVSLYARGYRYQWAEHRLVRTGAISVQTNVGATVLLNDMVKGNTSLLGNGYGIGQVTPGHHDLTIQRLNYSLWHKAITVEEGQVASFPNVVLVPTDDESSLRWIADIQEQFTKTVPVLRPTPKPSIRPPIQTSVSPTPAPESPSFEFRGGTLVWRNAQNIIETLDQDVLGYVIDPKQDHLAWWTDHEVFVLWLKDSNRQPFHLVGERELITRVGTSIKQVTWFPDEYHLVIETTNAYRIVEIDTRGGTNSATLVKR